VPRRKRSRRTWGIIAVRLFLGVNRYFDFGSFGNIEWLCRMECTASVAGADGSTGWLRRCCGGCMPRRSGRNYACAGSYFAGAIERDVCQRVDFRIQFAANVFDREICQPSGLANSAFVKRLQRFAFYFVAALHLTDKQFGIAANFQS